jgi:hypothetical protein
MAKKQVQKYFGDWSDHEGMASDWSESKYNYDTKKYNHDAIDGMATDKEVLLAVYEYEDYSGDAWVLFKRDGKLYEVSGGHCSCNGLEGQWEPSETTWKTLAMCGSLRYRDQGADALFQVLLTKHNKKPN